jgi:PAS domain S-box-containing protein
MAWSVAKGAALGFCLVVVVLFVNAYVAFQNIRSVREHDQLVTHSNRVLHQLETLLSRVKDAETGQRGYILTRREDFLEPYHDAKSKLHLELDDLTKLIADNPEQLRRLAGVRELITERMAVLEKNLEISRAAPDRESAVAGMKIGEGKRIMDLLRVRITDMELEEQRLLSERQSNAARYYTIAWFSNGLALALACGSIIAASYLIRRELEARKRATVLAHEQSQRLFTTLTSIGDAVIVTDTEGRVTLLNPVAQALTGWEQEAHGQPLDNVFRIVNEETRQTVESPVAKVLREGTIVGLANHTILLAKDGKEHPIDDSGAPIRGEEGQVVGVVLVFRDIHERKQFEDQQAESQRFLRSVLDALSSHIAVLDERGTILEVNDAWRKFAGRNRLENPLYAVGENYLNSCETDDQLCTAEERSQALEAAKCIRDVIEGKTDSCDMEYPCHSPDEQRWFQMRVTRFPGAGPVRVVVAHTDITQRIKSAIENERLYEELKQADVRKDHFLATLAHELRNPLAPISNALELWPALENDRAEMERLREMMGRQTQHMIRLIDDLLDLSRITRGKVQLRPQIVEVKTLIDSAVEAVGPFINRSGHTLEVKLPDEPLLLQADVARMVQVISNLLHNAAKYTGQNGKLSITARRVGDAAEIRVRDNGPGIPAAMLQQIFEMFTQVDQTIDRAHGGLGIGLTLAKTFVELHQGTIAAHSDGEGHGSEFTVTLPALPREHHDVPVAPTSEKPRRTTAVAPHRIVVVDDVRASAQTLALMLKVIGQEVEACHDGEQAIPLIERLRPDVVFLDIGMPGMDGYEVARRLRANPALAKTTLVALTGYGQDEDRRRSIEAGFNFHLVKPTSLEALEQLLAPIPATISPPPSGGSV